MSGCWNTHNKYDCREIMIIDDIVAHGHVTNRQADRQTEKQGAQLRDSSFACDASTMLARA